jgi:glycosyltransferase involved in cell wall biosynthesis
MNIYWISKVNNKTLYKTSRFEMSEELRKRGHHVKLITEAYIGEKKTNNEKNFTIPTIPFPILSGFVFGLFIFFWFPLKIRRENIDIIIIDKGNVWLPFVLPLKLLTPRLILDIRTLPITKKSIKFKISLSLSKLIVNGYTTITPELKNILIDEYNIKNKLIGIWTSGVSSNFYSKSSNVIKKINFFRNPEYFYLMYHGSYSPTRGIENLIESIAELEDSLKKAIKLIFIGIDPSKKSDLIELCKKLNIKDNVEFIPRVEYDDIPFYIDECDAGVIPLPPQNRWWRVSAPLKTLEYLARAKPVITTNIPFHCSIFDKGKCGLLINSSDKVALAQAITIMYKNKDELKIMGEIGRNIVEKYYTWEKSALELEKFIKKMD